MESLRERLLGPAPAARDNRVAWIGILVVTVLGGLIRAWRLGHPGTLVFDETYYVKQAWSLVRFGHERDIRSGLEKPDDLWNAGTTDVWGSAPDMVVHPPVGKWMIALGELVLGPDNPDGWRLASLVVGTLSILLLGRIAWQLWHNPLLAIAASTLMAADGHHFVQSRTGLLDIFVMWWVLLAFFFLLLDRVDGRRRLARRWPAWHARFGSPGAAPPRDPWEKLSRWWGPRLGMRWWRLAAGISLGLACGTKWSGLYFLAVFGLMTVWWDLGARRAAGVHDWFTAGAVRDGIPAFLALVPVAFVTYVASWTGWLRTEGGWKRQWAATHPAEGLARLVPDPLRSLWAYHQEQYAFHVGLQNEHAWKSNPWSWTVQWRPTLFYADWPAHGVKGCQAESCVEYVASLGNFFVWWGATIGMAVVAFLWLLGRDWRAGAVMSGIIAGWFPWFLYQTRTIYSFYAVAFEPWLVLTVVLCLGLVLGAADASPRRRRLGALLVVGYLTLAVAQFAWYYPVHSGIVIPRDEWYLRMWFDFWT